MKWILLSYSLSKNSPLYGNTPSVEITVDKSMSKGDSCNTSILKLSNHSGTHVDTPKHFWEEGRSIAEYAVHELIFNSPLVIDCPKSTKEMITVKDLKSFEKELSKCDILLLRTGFWKHRNKEIYRLENPGISPEIANYIRSKFENIRCIGVDSISVSSYANREEGRETHKIFLQKGKFSGDPLLIVEDMDLSNNKLDRLKTVIVAPLIVEGVDSSPCTVIGEMKE